MSQQAPRKRAPLFAADASPRGRVSLEDYRGRYLVLYFFPGAFTVLCTRETIGFRDATPELRELGAEVLGISPDPLDTQCKFAEHYEAKFPIASDPDGLIARDYGAVFPLLPRVKRVTFVIDPEGYIAARFHHELFWQRHIDQALSFIRAHKQ